MSRRLSLPVSTKTLVASVATRPTRAATCSKGADGSDDNRASRSRPRSICPGACDTGR